MITDIKPYLPFYLDRDYVTSNSQGNLNLHTLLNVIDMCNRGKKVKLRLRPLNDMTDEEHEQLTWLRERAEAEDGHSSVIEVYAALTKASIDMGFDVFGLIESGLAIDRTTSKQ